MQFWYTNARDFFEGVKAAAEEVQDTERKLERMKVAEGLKAQSYELATAHSITDVNGTKAINTRIDFESRMAERIQDDLRLLNLADAVVYGNDCNSGLAALVGSSNADIVWLRYRKSMKWSAVASITGLTVRTCQLNSNTALDVLDAHGLADTIAGLGFAED